MRTRRVRDFAGGLNIRDAANEIKPNESPDLYNVTLDERGSVAERLGYSKHNGSPYNASLVSNAFYWQTGGNLIVQSGLSLFKDTSTVAFKTFTTTARCGMADFAGKLCIVHPVDGFFTYDGATVAAVGTGPKGFTLAPWQNKLWSGGDPVNPARVTWCAANDPTSWPAANFIDLRDKDNEQVLCLGVPGSTRQPTGPALLAFKKRSFYRIYDSTSGGYQTVDPSVGACSSLSVVSLFGRTLILSERGIFETDGDSPMKSVGDKLGPLWDPTQIAYDKLSLACAGTKGDRIYFSLPTVTATANDLMLEYHPLEGWITTNSNAASCYANYGNNTQFLLGGSPSVNGQVYRQLSGGDDDGTAISSYFQTAWLELNEGLLFRLRQAKLTGRGVFTMFVRKDYETGQGLARDINIARAGFIWNNPASIWNSPSQLWGPGLYLGDQEAFSLGTARAVSFRFQPGDLTIGLGGTVVRAGGVASPTVGAWGVYGLDLKFVPLGLS